MAIDGVPGRVNRRSPVETEAEAIAAILAQLERLDYLYEHMAPVWREIEANLQKSQPK